MIMHRSGVAEPLSCDDSWRRRPFAGAAAPSGRRRPARHAESSSPPTRRRAQTHGTITSPDGWRTTRPSSRRSAGSAASKTWRPCARTTTRVRFSNDSWRCVPSTGPPHTASCTRLPVQGCNRPLCGSPDAHRRSHEALLRAVVNVAFQPPPLRELGGDDPLPAGPLSATCCAPPDATQVPAVSPPCEWMTPPDRRSPSPCASVCSSAGPACAATGAVSSTSAPLYRSQPWAGGTSPPARLAFRRGHVHRRLVLMQSAMRAMVWTLLTLTKSLWSENGLWFSSGNESSWY